MDSALGRFVYKYYPLDDRFVRVRIVGPGAVDCADGASMDRARYRREVVRACIDAQEDPSLERSIEREGESDSPALDLLYQLSVAVNPELDIHRVSLGPREAPGRPGSEPALETAPATELAEELAGGLPKLEKELARRIIGQPEGTAAVLRAVRRASAGLAPERGPLASLLFVGPTGTGKTELARVLADGLFGSQRLFRIDCSELAEAHETSRLVGAPPGYVGYGEGGELTSKVRAHPRSVVVFDEFEKAHPRLHNMLLQILEEGQLTGGDGEVAHFDEAFVLLTSNCGTEELHAARKRIGFGGEAMAPSAEHELFANALSSTFPPELLGRLDEVIPFHSLDQNAARQIARIELKRLAARVAARGSLVRFSRSVAGWVAKNGFEAGAGARSLTAFLRRELEVPLAEKLLEQPRDRTLEVRIQNGALAFG